VDVDVLRKETGMPAFEADVNSVVDEFCLLVSFDFRDRQIPILF
jgi:hypothetical protein